MHTLDPGASDGELLEAVLTWIRLLAADEYAGAGAFLKPHPDPHYRFTPEELRVYGAWEPGPAGRTMRVTSPDTAMRDRLARVEISRRTTCCRISRSTCRSTAPGAT